MKSARSISRFATHFATTYATALPAVMYRMTAACLLDPKESQQFVHDVLHAPTSGIPIACSRACR